MQNCVTTAYYLLKFTALNYGHGYCLKCRDTSASILPENLTPLHKPNEEHRKQIAKDNDAEGPPNNSSTYTNILINHKAQTYN